MDRKRSTPSWPAKPFEERRRSPPMCRPSRSCLLLNRRAFRTKTRHPEPRASAAEPRQDDAGLAHKRLAACGCRREDVDACSCFALHLRPFERVLEVHHAVGELVGVLDRLLATSVRSRASRACWPRRRDASNIVKTFKVAMAGEDYSRRAGPSTSCLLESPLAFSKSLWQRPVILRCSVCEPPFRRECVWCRFVQAAAAVPFLGGTWRRRTTG